MARLGRSLPNRRRVKQIAVLATVVVAATPWVGVTVATRPITPAPQPARIITGFLPANPMGTRAPPITIQAAAVPQPLQTTRLTVGYHPPLWPAPISEWSFQSVAPVTPTPQPPQIFAVFYIPPPAPNTPYVPFTTLQIPPTPLQPPQIFAAYHPPLWPAPVQQHNISATTAIPAPVQAAQVILGLVPGQPVITSIPLISAPLITPTPQRTLLRSSPDPRAFPAPLGFVISATVPPPIPRPTLVMRGGILPIPNPVIISTPYVPFTTSNRITVTPQFALVWLTYGAMVDQRTGTADSFITSPPSATSTISAIIYTADSTITASIFSATSTLTEL